MRDYELERRMRRLDEQWACSAADAETRAARRAVLAQTAREAGEPSARNDADPENLASDSMTGRHMVFDVESIGLHGEGFAAAWVVLLDGREVSAAWVACPPEVAKGTKEGRDWVGANVPKDVLVPMRPNAVATPLCVRRQFWAAYQVEKAQGTLLWADCQWPVESRFLAACVDDTRGAPSRSRFGLGETAREWDGPYPFHELATIRLAAGLDPLGVGDRKPCEEPKHHPLADARQSARLLVEALALLKRTNP